MTGLGLVITHIFCGVIASVFYGLLPPHHYLPLQDISRGRR
jgi:hypothetical protein